MVTKTPNLELTEVQQSDVGESAASFNDSFWSLDALVMLAVKSRSTAAAPVGAQEGDRYIVPTSGVASTDPWFGRGRQVAFWSAGGWLYKTPRPGWRAYVQDESSGSPLVLVNVTYLGTDWAADESTGGGGGTSLAALSDVLIGSLTDGQILTWNAGAARWENQDAPAPPTSPALADLTDVALGSPITEGQILTFDAASSTWKNKDSGGGGGGASNVTADTHPATPDPCDDEFEDGTVLDVTGTRFAGAQAWSWVNQGAATTSVDRGSLVLHPGSTSSDNVSAVVQDFSSSTFEFRAKVWIPPITSNTTDVRSGMYIGMGGSGKGNFFGYYFGANLTAAYAFLNRYTSPGSFASGVQLTVAGYFTLSGAGGGHAMYYRIVGDGTNVRYSLSTNGIFFVEVGTETYASFFGAAPIACGLFSAADATAFPAVVDWFRRVS